MAETDQVLNRGTDLGGRLSRRRLLRRRPVQRTRHRELRSARLGMPGLRRAEGRRLRRDLAVFKQHREQTRGGGTNRLGEAGES